MAFDSPLQSQWDLLNMRSPEFLRIEADLAMMFIDAAKTYWNGEHSRLALANARKALDEIRYCLMKPSGFTPREMAFLEKRCSEIESALKALQPETQDTSRRVARV